MYSFDHIMTTPFPQAVPEIPVSNVEKAIEYYVNSLGFKLDWFSEQDGIAGISQGDCRIFLANPQFREHYATSGVLTIWLNLVSKREVDQLYARWKQSGANIASEPEDKPWNLREFTAVDLDQNRLRVFYDFTSDLPANQAILMP